MSQDNTAARSLENEMGTVPELGLAWLGAQETFVLRAFLQVQQFSKTELE